MNIIFLHDILSKKKVLSCCESRSPAYILGFVIEIKHAEKVYKEIKKDCACRCNYWPIAIGWWMVTPEVLSYRFVSSFQNHIRIDLKIGGWLMTG